MTDREQLDLNCKDSGLYDFDFYDKLEYNFNMMSPSTFQIEGPFIVNLSRYVKKPLEIYDEILPKLKCKLVMVYKPVYEDLQIVTRKGNDIEEFIEEFNKHKIVYLYSMWEMIYVDKDKKNATFNIFMRYAIRDGE